MHDSQPHSTNDAAHQHCDAASVRLRYNHPKNYVGVPLAMAASGDTTDLISSHLVADTAAAVRGASELGLVTESNGHPRRVTALGHRVVETITSDRHAKAALQALGRLQGSTDRFITTGSRYWEPTLTEVYQSYTPAAALVSTLGRTGPVSLAELARTAATSAPTLESILLSNPPSEAIDAHTPLGGTWLANPDVYYSPITCQLKSQLWHAGILTERGVHTGGLAPLSDRWAVEPRHLGGTAWAGDA